MVVAQQLLQCYFKLPIEGTSPTPRGTTFLTMYGIHMILATAVEYTRSSLQGISFELYNTLYTVWQYKVTYRNHCQSILHVALCCKFKILLCIITCPFNVWTKWTPRNRGKVISTMLQVKWSAQSEVGLSVGDVGC